MFELMHGPDGTINWWPNACIAALAALIALPGAVAAIRDRLRRGPEGWSR